jgi:hypothetical protein
VVFLFVSTLYMDEHRISHSMLYVSAMKFSDNAAPVELGV